MIDSKESLQSAAENIGILPFFPNEVRGLSVQEMCAPGKLFGGNYDEGCWEWKGPVIRQKTTAYGKFFNRKAGFVSLSYLPDFLNYRRNKYPVKEGSADEMLLEIIRENDSLTSTELKRLIFGTVKRENFDDLPEHISSPTMGTKSKSLETPLQRLQMGGWIIISDFEYKTTKRGERYGWGVARYSTPENVFGKSIASTDLSPQESFLKLIENLQKKIPLFSSKSLQRLLS